MLAYNEAATVGEIVTTIPAQPIVQEAIAVDYGSISGPSTELLLNLPVRLD
jgi:hypothetical protein